MIFQIFQTFRLLIFGRLVLIHCMTHCIMQYIHISWPSLDFPCSSILRVDGSGLVESYGACVAVICRVWVLVLTAWRYIARRGSDGLPARSAASIPAASQPISTFLAEKEGLWNLSNKFSAFRGIQSILVPFCLLGPMGGVSTADSENGKGQKFFQGVKDHFFVPVVSSD